MESAPQVGNGTFRKANPEREAPLRGIEWPGAGRREVLKLREDAPCGEIRNGEIQNSHECRKPSGKRPKGKPAKLVKRIGFQRMEWRLAAKVRLGDESVCLRPRFPIDGRLF